MSEIPRSADLLVMELQKNPGLLEKAKHDPDILINLAKNVTDALPPPAYVTDRWTYRIVVLALGFVCAAAMLGAIYLSANAPAGSPPIIPDVLTALGAAAIGALAGILAPSPRK